MDTQDDVSCHFMYQPLVEPAPEDEDGNDNSGRFNGETEEGYVLDVPFVGDEDDFGNPLEEYKGIDEQLGDEDDGDLLIDSDEPTEADSLVSRDRNMVWRVERGNEDIEYKCFRDAPGPSDVAKSCQTPLEAWSLLFTDEILGQVVDYTNAFINSLRKNYIRERFANPTNLAEIKATVGIIYIIAALKASHMNTSWLWSTDGIGIEILPCLMSQNRFVFLLRCLRFENETSSNLVDPLTPIRSLLDRFIGKCQEHYTAGEKCALDATLVGFRGDCPFMRYMPGNLARYGLIMNCLVDVDSQFIYNIDVCVEKEITPDTLGDAVQRLCKPILGSGRKLAYSQRFGSVNIADRLLQNDVYSVSAIKSRSPEIPLGMVHKGKPKAGACFFRQGLLFTYTPPKGKPTILYSTLPRCNEQERSITQFYEESRTIVQGSIRSCTTFTTARKSSRWPLTMFYFLINVAGFNAQVILGSDFGKSSVSMEFLKTLGLSLVKDHLLERAKSPTIPKLLLHKVRHFAGIKDDPISPELCMEPPFKKFKRCEMCTRMADRKTKEWCVKCRKAICREHGCRICKVCVLN